VEGGAVTAVQDRPALIVQLPDRPLTLDDVTELARADEAHRYELVSGNLLVMPPGDVVHSRLISRIVTWLSTHGYADLTLATPGIRISERRSGRSPDALVLRREVPDDTVWIEPADVALVVEVVSPGSEDIDRIDKHGEYERAGVPRYWRIERDGGAVTVHMYVLGIGQDGKPTYLDHQAVLLEKLLVGDPPKLV
jgi:Uma2 family endonuclease